MSEEIKPQEAETMAIAELSDGKKFLAGGGGALAGIFIDTAMMHHNGVGGLIFGTALGAMTAFGYPVIRPMVDGVCREFNGLVAKRQALIERGREEHGSQEDAVVNPNAPTEVLPTIPLPIGESILHVVAQDAVETQVGPDGYVHLSETLRPEINKILSGRKVLFGVSDAGKSNSIAVLVEEIGKRYGAPLFLLDTEDEYRKIADPKYLARPLWMDKTKLPVKDAFDFAQWTVKNLRQVVINLQSYDDNEAAWLIIRLIEGVKAYEETHDVRVPCEFILDEAAVWLPQIPKQSTLSKYMIEDPDGSVDDDGKVEKISLHTLLERRICSVVVRRGRKRGMGFTLATQRIASISKEVIASANWCFLMRQVQPADFAVYKEYGITSEMALSLEQGEAFVFAPGKPAERHRFRLRYSPHGANTPGWDELREHQRRLALGQVETTPAPQPVIPQPAVPYIPALLPKTDDLPPTVNSIDTLLQILKIRPDIDPALLAKLLPDRPAEEEARLYQGGGDLADEDIKEAEEKPQEQEEVKAAPAPVVPTKGLRADEVELNAAIHIWNAGYNSERKLMKAFPGLTYYQAGLLRDRILESAGVQPENRVIE